MHDPCVRTGFILYVERYPECVTFYKDTLGLETLFATDELTCFAFGASYLMVEQDDRRSADAPSALQDTCLRMHVEDVQASAGRLQALGVEVDYQEHAWGTVAKFQDPDGNLCAFKDEAKFLQQVLDGMSS